MLVGLHIFVIKKASGCETAEELSAKVCQADYSDHFAWT